MALPQGQFDVVGISKSLPHCPACNNKYSIEEVVSHLTFEKHLVVGCWSCDKHESISIDMNQIQQLNSYGNGVQEFFADTVYRLIRRLDVADPGSNQKMNTPPTYVTNDLDDFQQLKSEMADLEQEYDDRLAEIEKLRAEVSVLKTCTIDKGELRETYELIVGTVFPDSIRFAEAMQKIRKNFEMIV